MPDQQEQHQRAAPTERMIAAALAAAKRHSVKLPPNLDSDFEVCKAFLDQYLSTPSPKALEYAHSIARDKGLTIPDEELHNARALSAWIDANK